MAFKKKVFEDLVRSASPDLHFSQGYAYFFPVRHIISGFSLEWIRDGGYVSTFAIPLYDKNVFFHYGFGDRIQDDANSIYLTGNEKEVSKKFLSIIGPEKASIKNLQNPYKFLELFGNNAAEMLPYQLTAIISTLLLVGMEGKATNYLETLHKQNARRPDSQICAYIEDVETAIGSGREVTRRLLKGWEDSSRKRMGIGSVTDG